MDKGAQVKMIVFGVVFVSLFSPRLASAQDEGDTCVFFTEGPKACRFNPGPNSIRFDFDTHSYKEIITATQTFWIQVAAVPITCPGPQSQFPDMTEVAIPYVNASDTSPGTCVRYDVRPFKNNGPLGPGDPILPADEHSYFTGTVHYRVAYDHPSLSSTVTPPGIKYDNPRLLRLPDPIGPTPHYLDLTDAVFANLQSGVDPGVDGADDGMSHIIVVNQTHDTPTFACMPPLDCTHPSDPTFNVFATGRTVPIKVMLSNSTAQSDLRLSFEDPGGLPHLAESSGNSNQGNMFRHAGNHFQFNWSTRGLAPGIYTLTISPGPGPISGKLFAPKTIEVTLQ